MVLPILKDMAHSYPRKTHAEGQWSFQGLGGSPSIALTYLFSPSIRAAGEDDGYVIGAGVRT